LVPFQNRPEPVGNGALTVATDTGQIREADRGKVATERGRRADRGAPIRPGHCGIERMAVWLREAASR
jgi:hypothetical protein